MTQVDPLSLLAVVRALLRGGDANLLPHIAVIGDVALVSQYGLAEKLSTEAVVHASNFADAADLFQADRPALDLLIFLGLPDQQATSERMALAFTAAALTCDVLLVLAPHTDKPVAPAGRWIDWIGSFIAQGYAPDIHQKPSCAGIPVLHLRSTRLEPAQIAAHLGLLATQWGQQTLIGRLTARQQDHLIASITLDAQALQDRAERLAQRVATLEERVQFLDRDWDRLRTTPGYAVMLALQKARSRVTPPGSRRERLLEMAIGWAKIVGEHGLPGLFHHLYGELRWRSQVWTSRFNSRKNYANRIVEIETPIRRPPISSHQASVDIIICIHNALTDVQRCLNSVQQHTPEPYRLILVDDGSDRPTRDFLQDFAQKNPQAVLLRSETASGYTKAANRGLHFSDAEYVVLLNSDTIVTETWLDRMIACAESDQNIGLVGPLSNTASWQSVPAVSKGGDWAENPLPPAMDANTWAKRIAENSARLYPPMPFLNGFCLLIRRAVIEQCGFFDEDTFGAGYGEENDYGLRARAADWTLALADDAYVFHVQSRSYSHERRQQLSARAAERLAAKHGQSLIDAGVRYCQEAGVLQGIRARVDVLTRRGQAVTQGRRLFAGRKLLFLLPIDSPGGGGNVIFTEAAAMQKMGVEIHLFNLLANRANFEQGYPSLNFPVHYGERHEIAELLPEFDAVIATWYESALWMTQGGPTPPATRLGYYIQDFEPYFFPEQSEWYAEAVSSYTCAPGLRRFTKTEWNRHEVLTKTGADCAVVGPSVDIDRFRPNPSGQEELSAPLRVAAMIRPHSPRRSPHLTMEMLRRLSRQDGRRVQITIFGVEAIDPGFASLPKDFEWRLAGVIDPSRVATLLSHSDIFVDFSTYQAMGLTALEAMAAGAAVIVPAAGGATSFARHGENALVVDTSSAEACWRALRRLVDDEQLRARLRSNAIHDACAFYPERAALNILRVLFGSPADDQGADR